MNFNKFDVSDELQVYRFRNGVTLKRPTASNNDQNQSKHTVASLLKTPCSIYFDNADGVIQKLNEHNVEMCGLDSINHAIGRRYSDGFTSESAQLLLNNDHAVMKDEVIKIVEEDIYLSVQNISYQALSIKMPWYNDQNKIIGLFGCSVALGKDSLAASLSLIASMGLLIPEAQISARIGLEADTIYLSRQQRKCAEFLLAGLSIKEIALRMKLSARTVESYLNNMKAKLKCHNKTALIVKLHEMINY